MANRFCQLPDKPSELIAVALDDLRLVEADDRYLVNMGTWHQDSNMGCFVCLAGAVMAKSCNADPSTSVSPQDFPEIESKLNALDYFRVGCVDAGLSLFGIPVNDRLPNREIIPYRNSKKIFHKDMEQLVADLKEKGL